jgi:hypothetical protein
VKVVPSQPPAAAKILLAFIEVMIGTYVSLIGCSGIRWCISINGRVRCLCKSFYCTSTFACVQPLLRARNIPVLSNEFNPHQRWARLGFLVTLNRTISFFQKKMTCWESQ